MDEYVASIFKVEVRRFRKRLGYLGKLQGGWLWDPRKVDFPFFTPSEGLMTLFVTSLQNQAYL
jgi:hypothetical protein